MTERKAIEQAAVSFATSAIFSHMLGRPLNWDTAPDDLMQSADWLTCAEYAQAAIAAYLATMREAGFVMVPVDPTQNMIAAAWRREPKHPNPTEAYRAMIAASD